MLRWYASLVAERRRNPDLLDDHLDALVVEADEDDAWLVLSRGALRVVANLSATPADIPVPGLDPEEPVILAWDPAGTSQTEDRLHLPGHSVALVRLG
jgi:maltooligosyltrehalose trehalohydrolase